MCGAWSADACTCIQSNSFGHQVLDQEMDVEGAASTKKPYLRITGLRLGLPKAQPRRFSPKLQAWLYSLYWGFPLKLQGAFVRVPRISVVSDEQGRGLGIRASWCHLRELVPNPTCSEQVRTFFPEPPSNPKYLRLQKCALNVHTGGTKTSNHKCSTLRP